MTTRGWRNKRFHELNDSARVSHNFVRFLVVLSKTRTRNRLTIRQRNQMTNYSRFLTWNWRPLSLAMLQGKSSTVSDNEDIEPLVNYLGETKVKLKAMFCHASPWWKLELPNIKAIKYTLVIMKLFKRYLTDKSAVNGRWGRENTQIQNANSQHVQVWVKGGVDFALSSNLEPGPGE